MARDDKTTWLTLDDFKPGIADRPAKAYPPGQATRENTYRCHSTASGGLEPLYQVDTVYGGNDYAATSVDGLFYIVGLYAAGPVISLATETTDHAHELLVATEWLDGSYRNMGVDRWRVYEDTGPLVKETVDVIGSGSGRVRVPDASTTFAGWGMTFGSTRQNQTTPATVGKPVVAMAWSSLAAANSGGFVGIFPNDTAPTVSGIYRINGSTFNDRHLLVTCHQGRLVIREETTYSHGATTSWATTEDLFYTDVNDPDSANGPFQFVPEQPDGYSVLVPMSADELFMLKQSGGVMLAGSLADPTIVNLPMVAGAGTGGVACRLGVIYGSTQTGLWVWPHGDTSNHLSPQMFPDFYLLDAEPLVGQRYQWEQMENMVFLSNNFIYDTDTQAFWRLEDPDVIQTRFMTRRLNWLYGSKTSFSTAEADAVWSWDVTTPATAYSWQSQPLWSTIDRRMDMREITGRFTGTGNVIVRLTTASGEHTEASFDVDGTVPVLQRRTISLQGTAIQVRIISDGGFGGVAPTVDELNFASHPAAHIGS